ncbi:hypothetical protein HHK36_008218 [Tetracentron sinense]|uniref:Glycine-rich domain-containing protein 1 n=1 Tax=Tetracentron sinense TaxID=13715 RepID=A0A835DJQ5_TETSI|nr:hypothetical protein HHK36_008218 [Tetracentron sinense]
MDKEQKLEWIEAQKIVISEDLVAAAKRQLQFLDAVDRNRCLYDGPTLHWAIYRYKTCWLPLLAKHAESQVSEGPLVVPLDCEWIWHCHRLNPVQYKSDCEKFYGRILDNRNVVSSVQGTSKSETEEIWNRLYPEEPYKLDLSSPFSKDVAENLSVPLEHTKYDLVSAVKRQSPFFYQVSRPSMNNVLFLEGAVARYKGFLHLIKRNRERSIQRFCVPTYDIDLIWHSHQLHPVSYCKDLVESLGKVLEHDDMDSDRTKGKKLDVGFSDTTKQWEETFGSRYWKAGAMYRGSAPSPLTITPFPSNIMSKKVFAFSEYQKLIKLPETKVVEVLLEIVGVRNLPAGHKGSLYVSFTKKQPDVFFDVTRRLSILSESGEKQVAAFQCEPTGELLFELMSHSPSNLPISKPAKTMGTTSISLQDFVDPISKLSVEKWFELVPRSGIVGSKPICLRIAVSLTVPTQAPHVLRMVQPRTFSKNSCFFPLPGRVQHSKSWMCVVDESGNDVINIQMRDLKKSEVRNNCISKKEVIGIIGSGETHVLAEFVGTRWTLMDSHWSFQRQKKSSEDGHIFEVTGNRMVKLFPGRKLEYEPKNCEKGKNERDFMTAVEFSAEEPYGKVLALLNLKSGFLKVQGEWFVLPGIILSFILSDILRKEGYSGFDSYGGNLKQLDALTEDVDGCNEARKTTSKTTASETEMEEPEKDGTVMPEKGRDCSGGCGNGRRVGECGTVGKSSACGGCVAGGCEIMVKSGGCGGCGGGGGCGRCGGGGGCGGCGGGGGCKGGGGCNGGGGCSNKSTYEKSGGALYSAPKEAPNYANELLVA